MKKIALLLSMALVLSACGENETAPADTQTTTTATTTTTSSAPQSVANAGDPQGQVISVGVTSSYPPFVSKDEVGRPIGFDIDILYAIAKLEGINPSVVAYDEWSEVLKSLDDGQTDLVISAVTLTPEREQKYSASKPYVSTINALAVPKDSLIQSVADLKGKTIGVGTGSSLVKEKDKYPDAVFTEFESTYVAFKEAVGKKTIDAVIAQKLYLQYLTKDNAKSSTAIRLIDLPSEYPDKVILVKKGNAELVQKINSGLDKIKANGTYDEIYKKWFGSNEPVPASKPQ